MAYALAAVAGGWPHPALSQTSPPEDLADPMRPPSVLQAAPAAAGDAQAPVELPRLQAIMREGGQRLAVINGQLLRVGDDVGGATVTAITASSVVISVEGKSSVLKLVGQDVKVRHDPRTTQ